MAKYKPKTKPFPHQAKGTMRIVRHRNYALFFEPRCGKSKAALDAAGIFALAGKVKKVCIIGPRISLDVWEGQLRQHYPYDYYAETFDEQWEHLHKVVPDVTIPWAVTRFFLAGREETFRREKVAKKGKRKGKKYDPDKDLEFRYLRQKQKEIEDFDPDLIIVDEAHEFKRPGGVAAQDLWRLVRRLRKRRRARTRKGEKVQPWVVLLSGTPNPKGWIDLFAPYRIMDETILGTSIDGFKDNHVVYGTGRRRWTILRYRNEKRLVKKIRAHSMVMSADEAGLANETFFQNLRVQLPDKVKRMYLELAEEFITEHEGGVISAKNAGVKRIRLLQLTGGFTTDGQCLHREKLGSLDAWCRLLLEQEESVVVYSRFSPEVSACAETLDRMGFRSYIVDGSVSRSARREALGSLASRPKSPTAISFQFQAGSRAIELVGAAETVFYSPPDGWVDYWQCVKRTQGPNQKRPLRYTHLVVPGTVDIGVIRGLQRKEDWHQTMMQNPRRFLRGLSAR